MPLLLRLAAVEARMGSGRGEPWLLLLSTALLGLGLTLEAECARRRLQVAEKVCRRSLQETYAGMAGVCRKLL